MCSLRFMVVCCGILSQPSLLIIYLSMLSYGCDPRGGGHYQLFLTTSPGVSGDQPSVLLIADQRASLC